MTRNPTWLLVVAAAFCDENGRWLMHRRPEGKQHGGLWEFPGGKVEWDETPQNALVREVKEELAVDIAADDLQPLAFNQSARAEGAREIVILLYKITRWAGDMQAMEGGAIEWFTPDQIAKLDKPPLDIGLCEMIF